MSAVPVSQAAPVFQMRAKPSRMCTAALVSGVRLPMTFVVYASTKAAEVLVAAEAAAAGQRGPWEGCQPGRDAHGGPARNARRSTAALSMG